MMATERDGLEEGKSGEPAGETADGYETDGGFAGVRVACLLHAPDSARQRPRKDTQWPPASSGIQKGAVVGGKNTREPTGLPDWSQRSSSSDVTVRVTRPSSPFYLETIFHFGWKRASS